MTSNGSPPGWLLLLHQFPQSPQYLRAKTLRRLGQVGALALKNSAYILPSSNETEEDLRWIARDIRHEGGEAWIFRIETVEGLTSDEIVQRFQEAREADFAGLARRAREALDRLTASSATEPDVISELRRLREQRQALARIDFFDAPGGHELEAIMTELAANIEQLPSEQRRKEATALALENRRWVTRSGVKIDRMASAWLIQRFIDPRAQFVFVTPARYEPLPGDLRFDMFDGEFSHEGQECTFEVLLRATSVGNPALRAVGEVVHDIDLKDQRYGRPEANGVGALVAGIVASSGDDETRLSRGAAIFDALYAAFVASEGP